MCMHKTHPEIWPKFNLLSNKHTTTDKWGQHTDFCFIYRTIIMLSQKSCYQGYLQAEKTSLDDFLKSDWNELYDRRALSDIWWPGTLLKVTLAVFWWCPGTTCDQHTFQLLSPTMTPLWTEPPPPPILMKIKQDMHRSSHLRHFLCAQLIKA